MKNRFLLGAGVALAVALGWANAQAQLLPMPAGPGAWYFGGEGGWTSLENEAGTAGGLAVKQSFNDGFNIGFRAGYEWGPLRLEEEFRWLQAGQSTLTLGPSAALVPFLGVPGGTARTSGNRDAYAFMTNAIYDFSFGGWPGLTPHLGVGIGAVELHDSVSIKPGQVVGISCPSLAAGCSFASNSQWEFGYQAIAGVRYNINPALAFDLDYRFLGTTDPSFVTQPNFGGFKYTSGYHSHSLVASLSMRFGPAPVAAPPAAPAPPLVARKVFLVFFDWDKDPITPEGMAIVQQAAAAFRSGAPVTIQVTGYTDASGSAGYNQRLSERRANNVANALVRLGVPRQAMVVSGRGKNDQRVPTADGVREPQNRRFEILFP